MYGKHFAAMYEGSMVGAGAVAFAVMGYVIAKQEPDREVGAQVELNPKLLSAILGEPVKTIEEAIEFLCAPDDESRSKVEDGRRLVRLGQFAYRVVNGAKYLAIRDRSERREYQRNYQKKRRAAKSGKPLPGETGFIAAVERGAEEGELSRISDNSINGYQEAGI